MTIRKTLLIAFLLASLIPSILLTLFAFGVADDAMQKQIEQILEVQAATVSQNIDKMLFERFQNAETWRGLEVMQDLKINDIDKRLSKFLLESKIGYQDVYLELFCTNISGKIVASSNPANIGKFKYPDSSIRPSSQNPSSIHIEPLQIDQANESDILPIEAAIPSTFDNGQLGNIYLLFNWSQLYNMLDQAAGSGNDLVVIDDHGRIIAASSHLRKHGVLLKKIPSTWMSGGTRGVGTFDGSPLNLNEVIVAFDRSSGFQKFPGFNWTTLVIENSRHANIPVRQMAILFFILLAITSAFAVGFSLAVTGRVSRPIIALTRYTRSFMNDTTLPKAPHAGNGEVGELTEAFVQTMRNLEQSKADLISASKLAVLGELAAVMAHEIRTPASILRSSAQMLAREPGLSNEARELTSFIESETERLNRLVSTLLDSAQPRPLRIQSTNINQLIEHATELLSSQSSKKNIHISHSLMPDCIAQIDKEQMTQVILNLLLNSLQILPIGGHVSMSTYTRADSLIIEIADDGPGIKPEDRSRIFDPFFTKREGGVGLGLAVVQQIILAHKGSIQAGKSSLGGALFTIILPMKEIYD